MPEDSRSCACHAKGVIAEDSQQVDYGSTIGALALKPFGICSVWAGNQ